MNIFVLEEKKKNTGSLSSPSLPFYSPQSSAVALQLNLTRENKPLHVQITQKTNKHDTEYRNKSE